MPPKKKSPKKKKTSRRTQDGAGIRDWARKAHRYVKEHRLISRGLAAIPNQYAQLASRGAAMAGYGPGQLALVQRPVMATAQPVVVQQGSGLFSGLGALAGGIGSLIG